MGLFLVHKNTAYGLQFCESQYFKNNVFEYIWGI